ncbi:MAG: tripartite tricarboxylate transporter TctB family protein [Cypionkella sp.]|nr:tripartite tricarboxylate transporter TctB family protein [Cypionkella sp.]
MSASRQNNNGRRPFGAAFIIALGLAALGALLIWQGFALPDKSGYAGIGSGAAPKAIGTVLILLALGHVYSGLKSTALPHPHQNWGAIGWIVGGLLLQLVLLKPLGFTIASALLFACTARAMGYKKFQVSLPAGLILAFVVYGVFDGLLKLNLPASVLEHLVFGG